VNGQAQKVQLRARLAGCGHVAVHQETVMFDELSAAENIFIGRPPLKARVASGSSTGRDEPRGSKGARPGGRRVLPRRPRSSGSVWRSDTWSRSREHFRRTPVS